MSYVYFIGAVVEEGKAGAVKIGYSSHHPNRRMKELQTGHPGKLYLILYIEGTMDLEKALHRRFEHLWLHGEWFRWEGELHDYIWGLLQDEWETQKELLGIVD